MSAISQSLFNSLTDALKNLSGDTSIWLVFALLLVAFGLPVFLLVRALASRGQFDDRASRQNAIEAMLPGSGVAQDRNLQSDSDAEFAEVLESPQMQPVRRLLDLLPSSVKISKTVTIAEPTVVKMDSDDIKRAADLLRAGGDMDAVCRQVNPGYAQMAPLEQRMLRMTLAKVIEVEGGGAR
jgi:hypothetical protein